MSAVLPNPFYYLENFQCVLDWIAQRYDDLLIDEERRFLARFPALPQASRALLTRMVMRKGSLFRASKLHYDEIGCPDQAAQALLSEGWLEAHPPLGIEELFQLLRKPELARVFDLSPSTQSRKTELLESLRDAHAEMKPLAAWHEEMQEAVYAVRIGPLCERFRLMFFGNLYQTWSEFVLSNLGIYRYEDVAFDASSRGFLRRSDVDDYLHLHRCRERFDQGEYLDDIVPDIPAAPLGNSWLEGRRQKLLFRIAQQYERCGEAERALAIYRCCHYPGARLRTIRVLERGGKIDEAATLANIAAAAPENEAESQAVQRTLPRLQRKLGLTKAASKKRSTPESMSLCLSFSDDCPSVERAVCIHFAQDDAPVFYVENTLFNSLFGLLCWPAIFAALPGAFFHPFHHGPADLSSPDFHTRRTHLFEACLSQLESGAYRQTVVDTFRAKHGIQSPFVFWEALDETLLMLALDCIPPGHLRACFERMLIDIPSNRSGFPDLIQFWPGARRYRMIEVKGPGDRLQDNQLRWLQHFAAHEMPVAVCYVQWENAA
jgi:hypothetical protein